MTGPMDLAEAVRRVAAVSGFPGGATVTSSPDGDEVTLQRDDGATVTMRSAEPFSGRFLHLDVLQSSPLHIGGRRQGFAVLPAGEVFRLRDAGAFLAFWAAVELERDPLALAQFLALYQGTGDAFDRPQNVAATTGDFRGALSPETAEAVPGFSELTLGEDGRTLAFCTFFISPEPPDGVFRIGLNRWDVSWVGGLRHWEARPLARGLPSPRYGG